MATRRKHGSSVAHEEEQFLSRLYKAKTPSSSRILVGVGMTGLIRSEWAVARYGQVIPCNWSQTESLMWLRDQAPIDFLVADMRNVVVSQVIKHNFDWLFFIDHDVIIPPDTVIRWNDWMLKGTVPVISGLYFTKSVPSEPLVYRGRGNSYYTKWKFGDKVWVSAVPMGCTLIHSSLLKVMWKESEPYTAGGFKVRRVFETPSKVFIDPEQQAWFTVKGTEDLAWCHRVKEDKIFEKAGWKEFQKKRFPFLLDTNVYCKHIDMEGVQYPSKGEEGYFLNDGSSNRVSIGRN